MRNRQQIFPELNQCVEDADALFLGRRRLGERDLQFLELVGENAESVFQVDEQTLVALHIVRDTRAVLVVLQIREPFRHVIPHPRHIVFQNQQAFRLDPVAEHNE